MRRSSDHLAVLPRGAISRYAALPAIALVAFSMARAEPLDVFRDCDVCPEMIELPMGEFLMGAPEDEFRRIVYWRDGAFRIATEEEPYDPGNEGPQYRVTVDIPIAMGKNEVTYSEWMACVEDGGCGGYVPDNKIGASGTLEAIIRSLTDNRFKHLPSRDEMLAAMVGDEFLKIGGRYPVLKVSLRDAEAYTDWLNRKLGTNAYRLPTEAEWEYAARAGTTTRFAQGFEPTADQANISGDATELVLSIDRPDLRSLPFPVPVDEMDAANAWGLQHMSGNAVEMTLSCYVERYQGWPSTSEWLEKSRREGCAPTIRGGGNSFSLDTARVAWRGPRQSEWTRTQYSGFRVVKETN